LVNLLLMLLAQMRLSIELSLLRYHRCHRCRHLFRRHENRRRRRPCLLFRLSRLRYLSNLHRRHLLRLRAKLTNDRRRHHHRVSRLNR
jgi:hypothetical protein